MALSSMRFGKRSLEYEPDDPLTRQLAPPKGETREQMELRLSKERAAQKISDDIDRELRSEELAARKRKCVKILLLGQSESGKSTVLKNFQRKYDPMAFDRERQIWRSVCQLNVLRSFAIILDILDEEEDHHSSGQQLTPPISPLEPSPADDNYNNDNTDGAPHNTIRPNVTDHQRRLINKLAPLRRVEQTLMMRFQSANRPISPPLSPRPLAPTRSQQELQVNGYTWQRERQHRQRVDSRATGNDNAGDENVTKIICTFREDMIALWKDSVVQAVLAEHGVGKEDLSTFFLDDLPRIAVPGYTPTDDDILRARIKTMGVTEHCFTVRPKFLDTDPLGAQELKLYDVGGSRNQRSTWIPYFEDANAIIFLAPMSAFDQALAEAPDVNRLEDTFLLWKKLCSSKLLSKVSIVLLLNKRDILQAKLEEGVQFKRFVKSYTGKNQWAPVARYLKTKFKAVQKELSPHPRLFYGHITCATDTRQMAMILSAIEDLVLRRNLEQISLL